MYIRDNNVEPAAKRGAAVITTTTTESAEQAMALYSNVLLSWLEKYDAQYYYSQQPEEVRKLVKDTLDLLVGVLNYFSCPTNMLTVVIKYANEFVVRNGIRQVVLLHLLFISTITTIKMWGTENMAVNQIIADLFHLSLVDINNMEREFLKSLDYELYLTDADVSGYLADITAAHAAVLRHRARVVASKKPARGAPSSSASSSLPPSTTYRPATTAATPSTNNKRKAAAMYNYDASTPSSIKHPRIFLKAAIVV